MKYGTPRQTLAIAALLLAGLAPAAIAQEQVIETPKPTTTTKAEKATDNKPLKAGDAAPKLEVEKWVKGSPVDKFEAGKLYVVEFWATWCGPCKVSIPHLTELQEKYKDKVTIIGVSVWEENNKMTDDGYLKRVTEFVADQGDDMAYTVAFGGKEAPMSKTWMKAAQQNGIPTAFIVGKEGKIVWIGSPFEMADPLADIVAGKYDAAASAAKTKAKADKLEAAGERFGNLMQEGKKADAMKVADEIIEIEPMAIGQLGMLKFRTLLVELKDEKAAYAYAKTVSEGAGKRNSQLLNAFAWTIVDEEEIAHRDLDLAMTLANRADTLTKHKDPMIMDTLAHVYFAKGDAAKAIEIETKALKFGGDKLDPEVKDGMEAALKKFQAGKK